MVPVVCPRIAGVAADLLHINTEQALVLLNAVRKPCSFIENIERQLLNERYLVYQDAVALDSTQLAARKALMH